VPIASWFWYTWFVLIVLSLLFWLSVGPEEFIWVSDWATPGCQYELVWILTCGIIRTTLEVGFRGIILKHDGALTDCCSFESWRDKDIIGLYWRYKGDRPTKNLPLPYDLNVILVIDSFCLSWLFYTVYCNHIHVLLSLCLSLGTLLLLSSCRKFYWVVWLMTPSYHVGP